VNYVFDWDFQHDLTFSEVKTLLGGKAANLTVMALDLGLPVPPAFTITTAACNVYLANGWPDGLDAEIREHLATIEQRVGRRFGDPADPLLVSVRSGAPVSMPGMMDTILDLGLNDETTRGLAAVSTSPTFAADCRTRFEKMFKEIVDVDVVPDDPWAQLRAAIEAVFRSWNSDRARTYRRREAISEDLGTAVTVQTMVFGNRSVDSGSGVLFTRNPATGEPTAYGDVMFDAQGEDVVAGTHPTDSLAELAVRMPSVASELDRYAVALERHHTDMCDIEFTIEHGKLWLLQCRIGKRSPQAALRIAVDMAEAEDFPLTRTQAVERVTQLLADPPFVSTGRGADAVPLATGLPASPGMAAGEIATTPDAAIALAEAGRSVILVRSETSPDDVHGMARAAGLLTSSGGLASHAAVVARGWGIPAVVRASAVLVSDDAVSIGGRIFALGSPITINGSTGEIFDGVVAGTIAIVPEAEKLRRWARELGIQIGDDHRANGADVTPPVPPDRRATDGLGKATRDNVLSTLAIKGYVTPDGLAEALFATSDEIGSLLDSLIADGLVEGAADSFRLAVDGKDVASQILAEDRDRWGTDRAARALDSFLTLDHRMKETVNAWQMRDVEGSQTFNDHADPAYDALVLAQLEALHGDALAWLSLIVASVARYKFYIVRLDRAARLAAEGDPRYVASPRVDSYHSIWFELHEDLILLSGRTRAEEVAAGRA
jgi:Phosphoenolpyruvate synthase/pyruvate phosphate dikinase